VTGIFARIKDRLAWHRYEENNRLYDTIQPDGRHSNPDAEQHRQSAMLLEDVLKIIASTASVK